MRIQLENSAVGSGEQWTCLVGWELIPELKTRYPLRVANTAWTRMKTRTIPIEDRKGRAALPNLVPSISELQYARHPLSTIFTVANITLDEAFPPHFE